MGDRFTAAAAGLSATSIEARRGNPRDALGNLSRLLDEWHRAGSWNPTWLTLRLCIDVFVRLHAYEAAAQILGAMRASTTAGPAFGADAQRLARAQAVLGSCLGPTSYELLVERGATLGDGGAVTLARRTLDAMLDRKTGAMGRRGGTMHAHVRFAGPPFGRSPDVG